MPTLPPRVLHRDDLVTISEVGCPDGPAAQPEFDRSPRDLLVLPRHGLFTWHRHGGEWLAADAGSVLVLRAGEGIPGAPPARRR
jgi:hypothetical protein